MKITTENLKAILKKCLIINFFFLIILSLAIFFSDQMYAVHSRWFLAPKEEFVTYIYYIVGFYKLAWIFFNVVPYIALRMMDKNNADS